MAAYLADFPLDLVGEIHLAGHESEDLPDGPLLIDSHSRPVADPVWTLYAEVLARTGPLPSLIEWDNDIPSFEVLMEEAARADAILKATKVDGVYTADPAKDPNATRYTSLTFDEAMTRNLQVLDATAFALCRDQNLPIKVFSILKEGAKVKNAEGRRRDFEEKELEKNRKKEERREDRREEKRSRASTMSMRRGEDRSEERIGEEG